MMFFFPLQHISETQLFSSHNSANLCKNPGCQKNSEVGMIENPKKKKMIEIIQIYIEKYIRIVVGDGPLV